MQRSINPFSLSEDVALAKQAMRRLLGRHWPAENAEAASADAEAQRRLWKELAQQGFTAIGSDPSDPQALMMCVALMQELGRASCPLPLLDAFLFNLSAAGTADQALAALIGAVHAGERIPVWIFPAFHGDAGTSGHAAFVENAHMATDFAVITEVEQRRFVILDRSAAGVGISPTPGLSRPPLSEVDFDGVAGSATTATREIRSFASLARLLLAARALGSATRGFELLVDYVKQRSQFGKKIGSYQAMQHKMANILTVIETCRLTIERGGSVDLARSDFEAYPAAVAVASAARTLRDVVLELHHGFGGVSFWEDHEMPRHFRRVHGDLVRLGGLHEARREIADLVLGPI